MLNMLVVASSLVSVGHPAYTDVTNDSIELKEIYNITYNDTEAGGDTDEEDFPPYKDRRTWNMYVLYLGIALFVIIALIFAFIFRKKIKVWRIVRKYKHAHPEHRHMSNAYVLTMAKVKRLEMQKKEKVVKLSSPKSKKAKVSSNEIVQNLGYVHNISTAPGTVRVKNSKTNAIAAPKKKVVRRIAKPEEGEENLVHRKPSLPVNVDKQEVTRSIQARLNKRKVGKK